MRNANNANHANPVQFGFLGGPGSRGEGRFRAPAALAHLDVLVIDFDAIVAEYAAEIEHAAPVPRLTVRGSAELLGDARRWRVAIARFMRAERLVVLGWQRPPLVEVHTVQDLMPFTLNDLLPGGAPRIEVIAPALCRPSHGEPFASFYATLGPLTAQAALVATRGEPILQAGSRAAALYAFQAPAHVLLTPWPSSAQAAAAAIETLAGRLLGSYASTFVPAWADALKVPGEEALAATIDQLDAAHAALEVELAGARARAAALHGRKVIFAGSLERAARAAGERYRALGAVVMREFPDDHAFVVAGENAAPRLMMFADDDAEAIDAIDAIGARASRLRDQFQHEFDEPACVTIVVSGARHGTIERARSPHIDPAFSARGFVAISAYELTEELSRHDD